MTRLVLIDGSAYLFRAYHAMKAQGREFTAPDGFPTSALHVVLQMIKAHLKEKPEHLAFVFDASGPTFRDALDPQY